MDILKKLVIRYGPDWFINWCMFRNLNPRDKKRVTDFGLWMVCVQKLVNITQSIYAQEACEFLKRSAFPAKPLPSGFNTIGCRGEMLLPVVVLLKEDSDIGGIWKAQYEMNDGRLSCFLADKDSGFAIVALKEHIDLGDLTKGLVFLCEARRAMRFFSRDQSFVQSEVQKKKDELGDFEFECRTLELYLGDEYAVIVGEEVERMKKLGALRKKVIKFEKTWFLESNRKFKEEFFEGTSQFEKEFFQRFLMHSILFAFIDRHVQFDKETLKLDLVDYFS